MLNNTYKAEEHNQEHACWIEKCRKRLLDSEEQNLRTRALYWTQIVNMKTTEFNNQLNIRLNVPYKQFEYKISNPITSHLNYLVSWKGLRSEKLIAIPKKYQEFEFKAKNWLCGRRAPNYANTLFPEMILNAEYYSTELSLFMFKDCVEIANLYKMGLMFGYLSCLCSEKISLNDRSKKTYLMFENCLKKDKNPTFKLLQKYAIDNNPNHKFPNNMQYASQYFKSKYHHFLSELQKPIFLLYQKRQEQRYKQIESIHQNRNQNQNQNQLCLLINNLLYLQQQQQCTMQHLTSRVHQLENILGSRLNIDLNGNNNDISTRTQSSMLTDILPITTSTTSHSCHSPITPNGDINLNDFGLNTNAMPIQLIPVANNNYNNQRIPTNTVTIVNNMYDLATLVGNL